MLTVALTAALVLPGAMPAPLPANVPQTKFVDTVDIDSKSFYVGEWYVHEHEPIRQCITWNESRDAYNANTGTGKYRGAYQFSLDLAVGAGWMIQKDLRKTVNKELAQQIGESLRSTLINKWPPFWQDYAFWIVWNKGEGKKHWAAVQKACF